MQIQGNAYENTIGNFDRTRTNIFKIIWKRLSF